MPRGSKILGKPIDEDKWARAKARASEEGQEGNYAYIMDIYKKMTHSGEFKEEHVAERKKKGQKLPDWKAKKWDSDKRELKKPVAVKKAFEQEHLRLAMMHGTKDSLDEFRCGKCGRLLFKGVHLEKAMVDMKCTACTSMLVSPAMVVLELT